MSDPICVLLLPAPLEHFILRDQAEDLLRASQVVKESHTPSGPNSAGQTFAPTGSMTKSGATVGGWIVRLIVDGKTFQVRASSPGLETIGKSDASLSAFPRQ